MPGKIYFVQPYGTFLFEYLPRETFARLVEHLHQLKVIGVAGASLGDEQTLAVVP